MASAPDREITMEKNKPSRFALQKLKACQGPLIPILVLLLWPSAEAFGLQSHATPEEGLYSHQLGHLFFILSMVVFAFWLQKTRLVKNKGWRLLQISCFFFVLWNLDAIIGHELELWLSESRLVGPASSNEIGVGDRGLWLPYIYFFLKLDHFLSVPALLLLFLGLRRLSADSPEEPS
jgi:hypothetical protein